MPRLVGKRPSSAPAIALLFLIVIGAGVALEYLGYINIVPGFGRDNPYGKQEQLK
jgi:hypothetical protein